MYVFFVSLLWLSSAFGSTNVSNKTCPAPQTIPGCGCMIRSYSFRGPYVKCSNVRDFDDLHHRLRGLKNHPIEALQLYNASIPYLPRDGLFLNTHIEYLWLTSSSFKSFGPRNTSGPSPFAGLEESLTKIQLNWLTDLEYLDWEEMSNLRNLESIDVNRISANVIGENFSKLSKSFNYLNMFDGFVTKVESGAFALKNFTNLSLMQNNIPTLTRDIFLPNATKLTALGIALNQLQVLPDNFFEGMPSLVFLDMGRNNLTTYPSSLKKIWKQLSSIYLSSNPLTCDCNLIWLLHAFKEQPPQNSDYNFIVCDSPARLHGRKLNSLQDSDLCLDY